MRSLLTLIAVSGCAFEHGSIADDPNPVDDGAGSSDAATSLAGSCRYPDRDLRLCVEFDDGVLGPVAHDGSPFQIHAIAADVEGIVRGSSPAAGVTWTSNLRVPEAPALDFTGPFTLELFFLPGIKQSAQLIANTEQWWMSIDGVGRVTCGIPGHTAVSATTIDALAWAHLACTYDGTRLAVWIGGAPRTCTTIGAVPIRTTGTTGTKLASKVSGGVDDVRVYSRALDATEVCTHAGRTGCASACP